VHTSNCAGLRFCSSARSRAPPQACSAPAHVIGHISLIVCSRSSEVRPGAHHAVARTTGGEAAFLAIGDGAALWLTGAAAAGASRVRAKMAEAVVRGGPGAGRSATAGRFADGDLAATLTHPAGAVARSPEALALGEATAGPGRRVRRDPGADAIPVHARRHPWAGFGWASARSSSPKGCRSRSPDCGGPLWRLDAALWLGNVAVVDAEVSRVAEIVERTGLPLARWHLLHARATLSALAGDFARSEGTRPSRRELVKPSSRPPRWTAWGTPSRCP